MTAVPEEIVDKSYDTRDSLMRFGSLLLDPYFIASVVPYSNKETKMVTSIEIFTTGGALVEVVEEEAINDLVRYYFPDKVESK